MVNIIFIAPLYVNFFHYAFVNQLHNQEPFGVDIPINADRFTVNTSAIYVINQKFMHQQSVTLSILLLST